MPEGRKIRMAPVVVGGLCLLALGLKRPWNHNWRCMFRELHNCWHQPSTRTIDEVWRLTCGCRLVFPRRMWHGVQLKLSKNVGHPKCRAIHRLVQTHRRLDGRQPPAGFGLYGFLCGPSPLKPPNAPQLLVEVELCSWAISVSPAT